MAGNFVRNTPRPSRFGGSSPSAPYQVLVTPQAGDELTPMIHRGEPRSRITSVTSRSSLPMRSENSGVLSRSRYVPGFRSDPRYRLSGQGRGTISIPNLLQRSTAFANSLRSEGFVIPAARRFG